MAFADWVASSSSAAGDLSLGFNSCPTSAAGASGGGGLWASAAGRYLSGGIPPELFLVAPASSLHSESINALNSTPRLAQPAAADEATLRASWAHMKKPMILDHQATAGGGPSCLIGAASCQDCGNQAKKDCTYRRCRSCCKSRGYDCTTHVKSTWIPAVCRRDRAAGSSQSISGAKKPRLPGGTSQTTAGGSPTITSNTSPPRSFDTSSSHQDASFKGSLPGQVRAPAVFKCVRVTALEDGEDEFAYQAVVRIGGHVFKGFLYDQGREYGFSNMSELHSGGDTGGGSGGRNGTSILDPSGGTSYGNTIN